MTSIASGVPRKRYTTDEERYKGHLEACKRWYTKKAKPKTESEYGSSYSQEYHQRYYHAHKEKLRAYQAQYRQNRKQVKDFVADNTVQNNTTQTDIAGNQIESINNLV